MKKKDTVNVKFVKGEKILYFIVALLVILLPLSNVVTNALLSETNILVEELNYKITNQYNSVESLTMQINELASLENIRAIAEEYNLSYNNDVIIDIESE